MLFRYPSGLNSDGLLFFTGCWVPIFLFLLDFLQTFLSVKLRFESESEPLDFLRHMILHKILILLSTQDFEELIFVYFEDLGFLTETLG